MNLSSYLVTKDIGQDEESGYDLELFRNLLQPHFLFNSLNNLYALSVKGSERTPEAIVGLSHLLERVVHYARRKTILLSEEIQLIRDYIDLEKIWLGERSFRIDFQVKGDTDGVSIPPLTLYTLIENAFKHGIRKCDSNRWITIYLVVRQDKILLKIRNSVQAEECRRSETSREGKGLGIEAVRKLLEGSYHKRYCLDVRPIGDVFAVDLIIGSRAA